MRIGILARAALVALGASCLAQGGACAQGVDFYHNKSLKILVGSEAGGGFSSYSLLLSNHLGRYIPGNPSVTVEHRPGSGGINSINYLANAAPRDGTVIAVAMPNFFVTPFVEPAATKFNPAQFRFIGRMSDFGRVLAIWHASGARTVDDLKLKETMLAASARRSTTSIQPVLMNEILGTRMKVITGFMGSGPTAIAMEKGEIEVATIAWSTLTSLHPHWLRENKIHVIAGLDFSDVPIPGVPKVRDLIDDPAKKALWDFVALPSEFGTAFLAAPDVPAEQVRTLRAAFDAAMRSPEFLEDARKRNLDINPKSGEELDQLFIRNGSPTPEIIETVARVMGVTQ